MLLAIAGVTGVGKSFFKDKLVEKLGFKKIKIITTREIRNGEKNNDDKIFITPDEFISLKQSGKIAYDFEMLGNLYAYTKEELFSNDNTVFELHYNTIYDFKKICPNLCAIYIFPKDLNMAKQKTIERHLNPVTEKKRLIEIDEHYKKINTDSNLKKQFDYIFYNNYDSRSVEDFINLVKNIMNKNIKK